VIEEALIAQSVPYRVYGGLRFFERAEIKDALAYLRLIANRADDASFERVVNVPTRGIGDRTIEAVRGKARADGLSLWESATRLIESGLLAARAAGALRAFLQLIEKLAHETEPLSLGEKAEQVVRGSGLLDYHKADKSDRAESRAENLEELASAAGAFEFEPSEEMTPLDAFLAHAALEAGEREANPWEDCVQLMSLHSAKGLEFPVVFLTGLEEGLFPHQRSLDEPGRLEEERRLCYVGMTRAMKSLFITYAENRRLHGQEHYTTPSRFLSELPPECVEEVRAKPRHTAISQDSAMPPEKGDGGIFGTKMPPSPFSASPFSGMRLGSRVRHTKFGEGVILTVEGQGEHTRVQVNFAGLGAKWLVAAYANLEML
jgi:DNA helicase-2/ATP-dependent DNA helicase PcrA